MGSSTAPRGAYPMPSAITPVTPLVTAGGASETDEQRLRALRAGVVPRPDPDARDRMATMLYHITGWDLFGAGERAYVSRLWAEDWDSPEDSAYDRP
ncbi:MAG TPA: hypothetical protein VN840_18485 [Streptosporangiaceae bacterium]|nr:hypothetical protein [Streptosporangiaceae bacterium]